MATVKPPSLDEMMFSKPEVIQWWQEQGGQGLDENLIHRYVCESPFFDWTTKNGLLFQQAQTSMDLWNITLTRKGVEDFVKARPGTEYMIVGQPQPVASKTQAADGMTTGVWVVRKQLRERVRDTRVARPPSVVVENGWELTTLATYYLIGDRMYYAPSVGDTIGNRLLAANSSLNKFVSIASSLPRFAPSTGYSYLPPAAKRATAASGTESPSRSREGSVMPGMESQSTRSGSILSKGPPSTTATTAQARDARLLKDSFAMAMRFAGEYMDENPLRGEPGNFSFTSSVDAVQKRRADEEVEVARKRVGRESAANSRAASPEVEKPQAEVEKVQPAPAKPPAVFTEAKAAISKAEKAEKADRRGSKMGEKAKRRKSRPAGVSTPGTAM